MTNEERAERFQIQNSDATFADLWQGVKGICHSIINRYKPLLQRDNAMTRDDLEQIGKLACVDAARRYRSENGATFAAWYFQYCQGYILTALGCSYAHDRPQNHAAYSLDEPADPNDSDGSRRSECIADENVTDPEAAATLTDLQQQVRAAVQGLPDPERQAIQWRYLDGGTLSDLAELEGVSVQAISMREKQGMHKLRHWAKRSGYYDGYRHVGIAQFRRTWVSSTEATAFPELLHGA